MVGMNGRGDEQQPSGAPYEGKELSVGQEQSK